VPAPSGGPESLKISGHGGREKPMGRGKGAHQGRFCGGGKKIKKIWKRPGRGFKWGVLGMFATSLVRGRTTGEDYIATGSRGGNESIKVT